MCRPRVQFVGYYFKKRHQLLRRKQWRSLPLGIVGVEPVSITWFASTEIGDTITGLAAGDQIVALQDASGCAVAYVAHISEPQQPLTTGFIFENNVGCPEFAEGSLTAWVNGGTQDYQYNWSNSATTETISGLSIGNYGFTATDSHGCTASAATSITSADQTPPVLLLKN